MIAASSATPAVIGITMQALFEKVKKLKRGLQVAVHDSIFHGDDVGSLGMLMYMAETAHVQLNLCRTRKPGIMKNADIVVDVGGSYNPAAYRFDHHGPGGAGHRPAQTAPANSAGSQGENSNQSEGIPYSGLGLLWKHFGEEFVTMVINREGESWAKKMSNPKIIERIAREVDKKMIQGICAHDAGMVNSEGGEGVNIISVPTAISRMNPTASMRGFGPKLQQEMMFKAAEGFKDSLVMFILQSLDMQLGVKVTQAAIQDCQQSGSRVLCLNITSQAWRMLVPKVPHILLVIQPQVGEDTYHGIIAVPAGKKECRMYFPEDWAGHGAVALEGITGIRGVLFCHTARFYASASTMDSALKVADEALRIWDANN